MSTARPPLRWLELTPDYRCNHRCLGCYAVADDGASMTAEELGSALLRGRREGAEALWLGGGEPTLRRDLFSLVREARRVGYTRVKLQTNAAMLSYAAYVQRLVDAGVTEVAVSLKGADAATHDRITRVAGSHAQLLDAIANARAAGLDVEGDVLVYASTVDALPALVDAFHARGVVRFRVWSLFAEAPPLDVEVPRVAAVARAVARIVAEHPAEPEDFVVSLHTPPCTLTAAPGAAFDAARFGLLVVNPGGHAFRLEESPIEGGHYLPSCARCQARPRCSGVRRAYVDLHGSGEFVPLGPAQG